MLLVDVVVDDVTGFALQDVDDRSNDDGAAAWSALMHAREKARKGDEIEDVRRDRSCQTRSDGQWCVWRCHVDTWDAKVDEEVQDADVDDLAFQYSR